MSDTYTKLFSSITESTIWCEPAGTRLLWITFLAKCNRHGEVYGSIPGMARLANITLDECERGLAALLAPDPYSRTLDNEGRRIEPIDGGWRILNHAKFDRLRSAIEAEERERERKAKWDREHRGNRPNAAHRTPDVPPTTPDAPPTFSDAPPTPTVTTRAEAKATVRQAAHADGFDAFWQVYPVKKGKQAALKAWARLKLTPEAVDAVLFKLRQQVERDDDWLRGFAPHPATYLNGARWNDEIAQPRVRGGPAPAEPSKTMQAIQTLMRGIPNAQPELARRGDPPGLEQAALPAPGRVARG